jgi:hypothetical protein
MKITLNNDDIFEAVRFWLSERKGLRLVSKIIARVDGKQLKFDCDVERHEELVTKVNKERAEATAVLSDAKLETK